MSNAQTNMKRQRESINKTLDEMLEGEGIHGTVFTDYNNRIHTVRLYKYPQRDKVVFKVQTFRAGLGFSDVHVAEWLKTQIKVKGLLDDKEAALSKLKGMGVSTCEHCSQPLSPSTTAQATVPSAEKIMSWSSLILWTATLTSIVLSATAVGIQITG